MNSQTIVSTENVAKVAMKICYEMVMTKVSDPQIAPQKPKLNLKKLTLHESAQPTYEADNRVSQPEGPRFVAQDSYEYFDIKEDQLPAYVPPEKDYEKLAFEFITPRSKGHEKLDDKVDPSKSYIRRPKNRIPLPDHYGLRLAFSNFKNPVDYFFKGDNYRKPLKVKKIKPKDSVEEYISELESVGGSDDESGNADNYNYIDSNASCSEMDRFIQYPVNQVDVDSN